MMPHALEWLALFRWLPACGLTQKQVRDACMRLLAIAREDAALSKAKRVGS